MLDEEDLGAAGSAGNPEHPSLLAVGTHRNHEGLTDGLEIRIDIADGAVQRQDGGDVEACRTLKVGQPAHRFRQATGARIRVVLCRHMHHRHRLTSGRAEWWRGRSSFPFWLAYGRHPICLMPWVGRRLAPPLESLVRSPPAVIPASSGGR